jgi:hypothetical protein
MGYLYFQDRVRGFWRVLKRDYLPKSPGWPPNIQWRWGTEKLFNSMAVTIRGGRAPSRLPSNRARPCLGETHQDHPWGLHTGSRHLCSAGNPELDHDRGLHRQRREGRRPCRSRSPCRSGHPEQLSIVGYDDSPAARTFACVSPPSNKMPRTYPALPSTQSYNALDEGRTDWRQVVITPRLVIRDTTAAPTARQA